MTDKDRISSNTLLISLESDAGAEKLHQRLGAIEVQRYQSLPGIEVVIFQEGADLEGIFASYVASPMVKAVSYNYLRSIQALPNDPLIQAGFKWEFDNTGLVGGVIGADIDAKAAWDTLSEAPEVIVAVLDTGIRYTHEDLRGNMWINPDEIAGNGIDDDGNGYVDDIHGINAGNDSGNPMDDNGHGTHVAGIVGAVGNNGIGLSGVAWNIKVMALKFIDGKGDGEDVDAIECINYAIQNGASVINSSWGGGEFNQVLKDAIEVASDNGVFFVAAAGNEGNDNDAIGHYPSSYELANVVSVTATNRKDELAGFANFGENTVDLAAPGNGIYSCYNGSDSDYRSLDGSSMAAPLVSGTLGLLTARFPSESMPSILNRLLASVDPLESLARRCRTGGRLNLSRALMLESPPPLNDQFASATELNSTQAFSSAFNEFAEPDGAEPLLASSASGKVVWWRWTAAVDGQAKLSTVGSDFSTVISAFRGNSLNDLVLIGSAQDVSANDSGAKLSINVAKEERIYIAVDGLSGETGNISLNIGQKPVNDDFSERLQIPGINTRISGSNISASSELGEPTHALVPASKSVWWSWTSPVSGKVTISTSATNSFDTLLSVYTGNALSSLSVVAEDDDSLPGFLSEVSIDAIEGETYQIAVDSWVPSDELGGFGDITLTVAMGENDAFETPRIMNTDSFVDYAYSGFAKKELFEPDHGSSEGGRSLWWEWRPTRTGQAFVSTFGSDFDTTLAVYQGGMMNTLSLIGENDDDSGERASRVVFDVVAGGIYRMAVDGFKNDFGVDYGLVQLEAEVVENPSLGTPIIDSPGSLDGMVGEAFNLQLTARQSPTGYNAVNLPPGLTIGADTGLISGIPTTAGNFTSKLEASNAQGAAVLLVAFYIQGTEALSEISTIPSRSSVPNGDGLVLSVEASDVEELSYQWWHGGEAISGADSSTYEIPSVSGGEEGDYTVTVSNSSGSVLVGPFEVDVVEESLANISTRGWVRSGQEVMITGFFIKGSEPRDVLIRAAGASLKDFNVSDTLADPKLELKNFENTTIRVVDDWQSENDATLISDTAARVGAFPLSSEKDAAMVARLNPGSYTAIISGSSGGSGVVLAEAYDAATGEAIDTRLINISTRLYASNGDKVAIGGFFVKGKTTKRVVIRAVGPTLLNYDITNYLEDPFIELYKDQTLIASNDSWKIDGAEEMSSIFNRVGAFSLDDLGKEAAMVVDLPPGPYTVKAVDALGREGVCLIEVYEVW